MKLSMNTNQELILTPEDEFDVFSLGTISERIPSTIDINTNSDSKKRKVTRLCIKKNDLIKNLGKK